MGQLHLYLDTKQAVSCDIVNQNQNRSVARQMQLKMMVLEHVGKYRLTHLTLQNTLAQISYLCRGIYCKVRDCMENSRCTVILEH